MALRSHRFIGDWLSFQELEQATNPELSLQNRSQLCHARDSTLQKEQRVTTVTKCTEMGRRARDPSSLSLIVSGVRMFSCAVVPGSKMLLSPGVSIPPSIAFGGLRVLVWLLP